MNILIKTLILIILIIKTGYANEIKVFNFNKFLVRNQHFFRVSMRVNTVSQEKLQILIKNLIFLKKILYS